MRKSKQNNIFFWVTIAICAIAGLLTNKYYPEYFGLSILGIIATVVTWLVMDIASSNDPDY